MHIITRRKLRAFAEQYPDAEAPLDTWYRAAKRATWHSIAEVRATYPHADAVGRCTVFNIKGNDYRLITVIEYAKQTVYIRFVLTHQGYDKEKWKNDC